MNSRINEAARPSFPKRAIITGGMPYGNKGLHFGHIGGVFVPADMYARFLRNRLGKDNVIFVSGTDCYGSPIVEGHRKAVENEGFEGTVEQYVERNHDNQVQTLNAYDISLNIFEGSGLGCAKDAHQRMTDYFFETLYANGQLELLSTAQFYDTQAGIFLNGRQVIGRCPVQGCKSEKGYADECDLGHSYNPEELIAPKSSITGTVPELRPAYNWYFKLPDFNEVIGEHMANQQEDGRVRPFVIAAIQEFLEPPIIYIQNKFREDYEAMSAELPPHVLREPEDNKSSFEIEFEHISKRDEARAVLEKHDIRFRTGKTLVPFRLTGNIEWGVRAPKLEDEEDLTVWVWPESLWAPISFTAAKIVRDGGEYEEWRDWWCSDDAEIYQFIGEDNIYFYGVAQTALWSAMQKGHAPTAEGHGDELRQSVLVANHHVLFLNKKASSSGKVKPPMAADLLDHYESDQLRAHFLALGLGLKSVSFQPKPYDPTANEKSPDPVLKESALLTNIFNRIARSCFYTAQRINGNRMPLIPASEDVVARADETILQFEKLMASFELHSTIALMDTYLRDVNKRWAERIKEAENAEDLEAQLQVLADTFYALKVATVLMEPVAPAGTRMIFEYLNLGCEIEDFLSWENIFDGYQGLVDESEFAEGGHLLKELPPKTDFFKKHPSQFK